MSSTQLSISLSASDQATAGNFAVIVSNPAPGGGQSNSANFTVNNPQPSLVSVSPPVLAAGSPDTIVSVVGANFVMQSTVNLNGAAVLTTFVSPTQLSATVPANNLATGRVNRISVTSPSPGGGTAASINLIVTELLPAGVSGPLIQSLPPTAALVGKPTQYQVLASSANPSSLVFSLSTSPTGMAINAATGLLQWTPASNQVGDQAITIVAQDSAGQTSQSFTLSVFGSRSVASATISAAAGGVVTVSDPTSRINGLSISIPAGALAADTTITVSDLISPPTLGGTPRFLLKGFSVDPDGTPLAIPAQITVPYTASEFDTAQGIPLEDFLGVYFVDTSTGMLHNLDSFSVDKLNHVLTGTVPHFSTYLSTNIARLCAPLAVQPTCPGPIGNSTATPSSLLPAVLVHGFTINTSTGETMGTEAYWGQLRSLLGQLDSGNAGRIDAWRFDWDSAFTKFEKSAANLDAALKEIESVQPSLPQNLVNVNLVTHSFGGILVRTYLEGQATPLGQHDYRNDVERVMTIETPHTGIGGSLSTYYANACAAIAQSVLVLLLSTTPEPITCFEASTGIADIPGTFANTGAFLKSLNSLPLPPLNASLVPQYDIVVGERRVCLKINDLCLLQSDDGLITAAGADLCSSTQGYCSGNTVLQESNPGVPADTGLCHSSYLIGTTCPLNSGNIATTEVHNEVDKPDHPLWPKICTFLGCMLVPRTLAVASTNPANGTFITLSPAVNSGQTSGNTPFTLTYDSEKVVTLNAPATAGANNFSNWTGCDSAPGLTCTVTMTSNHTVTANYVAPLPGTHTLTVASTNPGSGVAITVSPADNNTQSNGTTQFTRSYITGVVVTLGAPATAGGNSFSSWTGCDGVSGTSCTVTMNINRTVTANYAESAGTVSIIISPSAVSVPVSGVQTITATVSGTSNTAVTWTIVEGGLGGAISYGIFLYDGIYIPPSSTGTFHIVATSQADASVQTTAVVMVTPALTFTVLHAFSGADGSQPLAKLVQGTDGNLYGTTQGGGTNGLGTIFKIDSSGNLTVLHSFSGSDGLGPTVGLTQGSDGNFYGIAIGGPGGYGTPFRIDPSGNFAILHSFSATEGSGHYSSLIQGADGFLYGMSQTGGQNGGGTAFRIDAMGNVTVLHSFPSCSDVGNPGGCQPSGGLVQASDGNFYGTTSGGGINGQGTIFKMDSGGQTTILHAFDFSDGSSPLAPMIQAKDGLLYGTAFSGGPGSNAGEVFKIDLNGNFSVLHAFDGPDGFEPETELLEDTDGYFYGITPTGGVSPSSLSLGVIYRIDAQGNVTVLHSFNAAQPGSYYPRGGIVRGSDGYLYGVAQAGGANQSGVIFKLAHP